MSSDVEVSVHVSDGRLYVFVGKMAIQVLCHVLNLVFCLLMSRCMCSV